MSATGTQLNPNSGAARTTTHDCAFIDDWNTERDLCQNGINAAINVGEINRLKIRPDGEPAGTIDGKRVVNPFTVEYGDIDCANHALLHMLANVYGAYTYTDNTTWDHWYFAADGSTSFAGFQKIPFDSGVLYPMNLRGVQYGGYTVAAEPNSNYMINGNAVAAYFDFWDDPTQETGSGSKLPTILGPMAQAWDESFTDDLWVRVKTVSGSDITVDAAFGSSEPTWDGSYSVSYTLGNRPVRLVDDQNSGAPLGSTGQVNTMPILFSMPTGATITALDVFSVPVRRRLSTESSPPWTQSLPTSVVIPSTATRFIVDGQEIAVEEGWNLEIAWETLENVPDVSKGFGSTPQVLGELQATLTPTRRLTDLSLQKVLFDGSTLSVVVDAVADTQIGATGVYYTFRHVLPSVKVVGDSYAVETGGENLSESVTLRAEVPSSTFNYDGDSFDSHVACVIKNTIDTFV